jgi:hypothetical protein
MRWLVTVALTCGCGAHEEATSTPFDPHAAWVLVPGAEPRRELHYALVKGTHTELTLELSAELATEGMHPAPSTTLVHLTVICTDVLPDGRMVLRSTIDDVSSPAGATARAVLDSARGLAMTAQLAPDGTLTETHVEGKAPDEHAFALAQDLAMPLPHVPVGVGAVWRAMRDIDANGFHMVATVLFELTGMSDDRIELAQTTMLLGRDQTIPLQDLEVDVTDLRGSSTGRASVDLRSLRYSGTVSSRIHSEMTAQGVAAPIDIALTMTAR